MEEGAVQNRRGQSLQSSARWSVQCVFAGDHARTMGAAGVLEAMGLPAPLADVRLWHMALADFGARQVNPGVTHIALDHGSAGEGLQAKTRHQVPRVII